MKKQMKLKHNNNNKVDIRRLLKTRNPIFALEKTLGKGIQRSQQLYSTHDRIKSPFQAPELTTTDVKKPSPNKGLPFWIVENGYPPKGQIISDQNRLLGWSHYYTHENVGNTFRSRLTIGCESYRGGNEEVWANILLGHAACYTEKFFVAITDALFDARGGYSSFCDETRNGSVQLRILMMRRLIGFHKEVPKRIWTNPKWLAKISQKGNPKDYDALLNRYSVLWDWTICDRKVIDINGYSLPGFNPIGVREWELAWANSLLNESVWVLVLPYFIIQARVRNYATLCVEFQNSSAMLDGRLSIPEVRYYQSY